MATPYPCPRCKRLVQHVTALWDDKLTLLLDAAPSKAGVYHLGKSGKAVLLVVGSAAEMFERHRC